jgi:Putative zinc- or iron-chelating domain
MTQSPPRWTEQTIAGEAYRAAAAAIAAHRTPAGVAAMTKDAAAWFDRVWTDIRGHVEAKGPAFACAAGCAWCCNQTVTIAAPEAIAIAEHVRGAFPPEALAALKTRLAALDDRARGRGAFARGYLKTPCALLVDGKCSVYDVRPVRCRSVYSRDVAHCRWVAENPDLVYAWRDRPLEPSPYPQEPEVIADAVLSGLATAARDAGLGFEGLELIAALRIALDTPDIAERYLAGEPVFAAAAAPESPEAGLPADAGQAVP